MNRFLARLATRWIANRYDALADKLEEIAPDRDYEPGTLGDACRKNVEPIRVAAEKLRSVEPRPVPGAIRVGTTYDGRAIWGAPRGLAGRATYLALNAAGLIWGKHPTAAGTCKGHVEPPARSR